MVLKQKLSKLTAKTKFSSAETHALVVRHLEVLDENEDVFINLL